MIQNEFFKSERLLYRPYQMSDINTLVKLRNEESRRKWFYFQEPEVLTVEFAIKSIEDSTRIWSRKVNILDGEGGLAIVLKENNELIGCVGVGRCRGDDIEIGYEIGEAYQNKGYATEAVKAALDWGFARLEELDAELRIVGKVEHENYPSRRVLEKSGFTFIRAEEYLSIYEIKK